MCHIIVRRYKEVFYIKRILSLILVLGLMLIPISVNAVDNTITIPSDVTFPGGAKIQFKSTCNKPVIVRVADEKQATSIVVAYGNSGTIYQGGTYKLVCGDNTPPVQLNEVINPFLIYSTGTVALIFDQDLDPESGIDLERSVIKINGKPIKIVIDRQSIVLGNIVPVTLEYNLVNGQSLSTGTQTYSFFGMFNLNSPEISLKPNTSVTTTTLRQQYQLPAIYRDSSKNLVVEAPNGFTVKTIMSSSIQKVDSNVSSKLTADQYSISPDKVTFYYNKFPDKAYMLSVRFEITNQQIPSLIYRIAADSLYNFVENFDIQHLSDKIVIKTKNVGLPLNKIGLDYYYFDLKDNGTRVAYTQTINPDQPIMLDDAERTFTLDLSKLKSGKYSMYFGYKIESGRATEFFVSDVYVSTPKQSISTKAYSVTVDKDATTVKINPGATISGIKINGVHAIVTNNSAASLSFDTMQIPNWAYDTIEPVVTSYTPPAPTPPTPTVPVTPTPTVPITPPATSTTIILQIGSKNMYVNGKLVVLDSAPIIRNDRTLLPIRFVAEALGAQVGWDDSTKKVTIQDSNTKIEMWINKPTAIVNGKAVYIDPANHNVVPIIVNARTMLPVRFVAESLGAQVEWDEALQKITVKR